MMNHIPREKTHAAPVYTEGGLRRKRELDKTAEKWKRRLDEARKNTRIAEERAVKARTYAYTIQAENDA